MLRRLEQSDIELIRIKRNSEAIRRRMHAQEYITVEDQKSWFNRVNTHNNFFFVIVSGGVPVGLAQAKDIDFSLLDGEGGIYVWDEAALASGVAARASLCLLDFAFYVVGLERITAKVRSDNSPAQRHNEAFGYKLVEAGGGERYVLEREAFLGRARRLRHVCSMGQDLEPTSMEDVDFSSGVASPSLYTSLPQGLKEIFLEKIRLDSGVSLSSPS